MQKFPLFHQVFQKARARDHKDEPPKRHRGFGNLHDVLLASYQMNELETLLADVNSYAIVMFGDDDAAIMRTPTMNILASSSNNPSCVLDAINCSEYMIQCGKMMQGKLPIISCP
jgi:hypothetical protein